MIQVWNISTQHVVSTLSGHTDNVLSLKVLTADGKLLASGSKDQNIIIWDLTSFVKLRTLKGKYCITK